MDSKTGWCYNVLCPWVISRYFHEYCGKEEVFFSRSECWALGPRPTLYRQCDCGQGSCALTIFLLRQLLMTPIYHTRWTLMMICTWNYFISYKVMPNAKGYLYRKTLLVVEDKLISRKQISPWLLRFKMDLDFVSSSIFCWVIFLKFYLDFILAKEFWQGSHRNKLQLGENFRFQIYPRNVLKDSTWQPRNVFQPWHFLVKKTESR